MSDDDSEMSISPRQCRSRSRSPVRIQPKSESVSSDDMFVKTPEGKEEKIQIRAGGEVEDHKGYYVPQVGEVLIDSATRTRYRISSVKGKGVFSCVVEVQNLENDQRHAIKVLRNNEIMLKSGEKEIKILEKLNIADPHDRRHIIRLQGSFIYQGHLCIKSELLNMNLRDLLHTFGSTSGLSLEATRSFAKQSFLALYYLKTQRIIHSDSKFYVVKPDNILITHDLRKIKLSDFGSALLENENKVTENLVARYYRPPEIFLGCPFDYSIDVWSLACSLCEIFTGKVLFPGNSDSHMLKLMMELKGCVPKKMRSIGKFTEKYFEDFYFVYYKDEVSGLQKVPVAEIKKEKSLGLILEPDLQSKSVGSETYLNEIAMFQNLMEQCLELDPNERITPELALKHPFFVTTHNHVSS